jgi:hypothetical protein
VVPFPLGTAAIACLRDASMIACWLGITRTAPGRSPQPADGPRPLSTAGARPQVALHGRRTAPGSSPRPADGPRPLSTAGGRPQAALHGRRTAPGRSPWPANGPRPLSTAGGRPRGRSSHSSKFSFAWTCYDNGVKKTGSCVDHHHQYVAS